MEDVSYNSIRHQFCLFKMSLRKWIFEYLVRLSSLWLIWHDFGCIYRGFSRCLSSLTRMRLCCRIGLQQLNDWHIHVPQIQKSIGKVSCCCNANQNEIDPKYIVLNPIEEIIDSFSSTSVSNRANLWVARLRVNKRNANCRTQKNQCSRNEYR